jgi:hypothetical protein
MNEESMMKIIRKNRMLGIIYKKEILHQPIHYETQITI